MTRVWRLAALLLVLGTGTLRAYADETPVAKVSAAIGNSYVLRDGEKVDVAKGMRLFKADQLVTSGNSMVKIIFSDGSSIMAYKDSSFEIEEYRTRAQGKKMGLDSVMGLVRGKIKMFVKPRDGGHSATVKSKNAVMGVRGTEFVVSQETGDTIKPVTKLVVLKGRVALSPLDEEGNPVLGSPSEEGGKRSAKQEVLVGPGETSLVVESSPPAPPTAAPARELEALVAESQVIAQADPLPEKELLRDMRLPAPTPDRPRPAPAEQPSAPVLTVTPEGLADALADEPEAKRPTVLVLPRDAVTMTELGLACNRASMDSFRHAAQRFDEEAVLMGDKLLPCTELQDEVFFWLFVYHASRGEIRRATLVTKSYREPTEPLDVVTPRERDLILFRKKDTDRILMRAGKEKKDIQLVLLAARASVLKGAWDDAKKLYEEALAGSPTPRNALITTELAYVHILAKDYDGARALLETLDPRRLTDGQNQSLELAFAFIRQQTYGLGPEGVFLEASLRSFDDADGWSRFEWGVGWQGDVFSVDSALGNVSFAKRGDVLNGGAQPPRPDSFGYSRLGLGARTSFSTGASGSVRADLYGSDESAVGFALEGTYPFLSHYQASLVVSQKPQYTEFVSQTDELGFTVTTLGLGLQAFDFVSYEFRLEQRNEAGNGLHHSLKGLIPVHRTADPDKRLDIVLEGRYLSFADRAVFWYTPKSAAAVLGGFDWNWRFGTWLSVDLGLALGYLTRDAHAAEENGNQSLTADPWLEREKIESAVLYEGNAGLRFMWGRGWYTSLAFETAGENAILDPSEDEPKPPSTARNPSRSAAKLAFGWDYGEP